MKKLVSIMLVLCMLLSVGAAASAAGEDGEPVYGGKLTVYNSALGAFPSYEPDNISIVGYLLMYEPLWVADWSAEGDPYIYLTMDNIMGQLAESWEIDEEAMTMTVKIHDDVYFQELPAEYDYFGGRQLTADDVKYTYDRLFGRDGAPQVHAMVDWPSQLAMLDSVESDGELTVVFHFNTMSDIAIQTFMTSFVNITGPEWDELDEEMMMDWHYACGTGAFILTDCIEGSSMTYVKNEKYYGYDERYPENKLPYVDELELVFIPDNANLQAEFIAGNMDLIAANSNVLDLSEQAQVRDSMAEGSYQEFKNDNTVQALVLNQNIEALQDINVRKALQYAINLEEIAVGYYDKEPGDWEIAGMYSQAITGYSSVPNWSDELMAEYQTYDPELAKQLLEEAGYGSGLDLELIYYSSSRDELLMLIQNYLAQVGVNLILSPVGHPSEIQGAFDSSDCMVIGTNELGMIDISQPYPTWHSGGFNYRLVYCDELDEYMDAVANAKSVAEAEEAAQAADEFIMAQHYALVISPVEEITFFASGNVGGYDGQMLWQYWNASTILPRLWNVNG